MKKFILLIFLFIICLKQLKTYVVYPLKTLEEGSNNIESLLSFNSTYTILEIGTPPQQVNFFFDLTHYQINITDKGCSNNNLYNRNKSDSFKIAFELELSEQDNNTKYLVLDSLYFFSDLNLTKKLKIPEYPLYFSSNISRNDIDLCGNIGLSIFQFESYNFESPQVKKYTDEIKKLGAGKYEDFSFFHYNNQDLLINDIFLQTQFPDLFKGIKDVIWIYPAYRVSTFEVHWEFMMKEIYYKNFHSNISIRCELNPLFELIVGINNFKENIIHDFFKNFIEKGICSIKESKGFNVIECDQEKFKKKDINKFPTVYLSHTGAKHIFELVSEELFIKINNKWLFEIVFPLEDLEVERWILGRIFMRKYPVKFAQFSKMIGFYLIPNEGNVEKDKKKDNDGSNSKIVIYIVIIVIALIFAGIGLFLGKLIFYPRKKRANELLDDNYEYESGNKEETKNKKNEIISDSPIN